MAQARQSAPPNAWPSRRRVLARAGAAWAACSSPWVLGTAADAPGTAAAPWLLLNSGPPGSIPDIVARRVAEQLARREAQPVIVDNRPGAAGQLAVAALKSGSVDGATLLLAQGAIATVYPFLYPKLGYDALTDLAPVSLASEMTLALAVGPAVPASVITLHDALVWLRSHPAQANVGSPGIGTLPHLLAAMLMREAGTPWQHIAYSGGPPAVVALLGGQIAALVLPEGLFSPHRAGGRVRVLATSGTQRTALLPDVPTFVEQGHADLVVREWFGFFMSGQVGAPRIEARSATLQRALAQPELAAQFLHAGMVAMSSTPAALAARIAAEQRIWAPRIRALGVQVE